MDESKIDQLAEKLRDLRSYVNSDEFEDSVYGICHLIIRFEDRTDVDVYYWLSAQFRKWPEFSGNLEYPVRGYDDLSPGLAFSSSYWQMWHPSHPYGAARRRLLDFLIEQAEAGHDVELLEYIYD